ncbi:superoxide dismutase family protein [Legionella spiritensis]|uniref:Superoxide dismutase [Cu-Zn] n=1 Tax=Legionella spiritensis TaxID=452 RepID=A0A0W0ZAN4_LEGSP|nr:superoxide dismutase family protein [Legionella spiritensis]KTD66089.1 superoxide dismutase, Cu, Zn [Legionella spiritensis]SNV44252.1 superoxide dismutase, Cu, Zn [Legionella spiritensis]VEG90774.1 superoxide dismutase, Cu, Zn [Legionella spiritensis]
MKKLPLILCGVLTLSSVHADKVRSVIYATDGKKELGTVNFEDTKYGLLITPELSSLPPGLHGFHLHQHPDCGDHGMDAGGHFDPGKTNTHQGPYGNGHLGDLPVLAVNGDGQATTPVLAPRLKTSDLKGLSVMVHAGGDNYSDNPPLGGGGARIACGKVGS